MIFSNYLFVHLTNFFTKQYLNFIEKADVKEKIIDEIGFNDRNILDYNCKTGIITIDIARARPNAHVVGVDTNHRYIRFTKRKKRKNYTRNLDVMNLSNLHTTTSYFDVVVVCFAFSNMSTQKIHETIKDIKNLLKEKSKLIILDYLTPKNKIKEFLTNLYHKISKNNFISSFLDLDISSVLVNDGFKDVSIEDFIGTKLIISTKNIV